MIIDVEFLEDEPVMHAELQESEEVLEVVFDENIVINSSEIGGEITLDRTLKFEKGVLSVNTAKAVEQNNTLPITSAAVHVTVGNIEALLETI